MLRLQLHLLYHWTLWLGPWDCSIVVSPDNRRCLAQAASSGPRTRTVLYCTALYCSLFFFAGDLLGVLFILLLATAYFLVIALSASRSGVWAVRAQVPDSVHTIVQPMNPRWLCPLLSVEGQGVHPRVSGNVKHAWVCGAGTYRYATAKGAKNQI